MRNEVLAQFSYSNITAPFSGVVTNTFVKEGDMANPGMPLVSVEGTGVMKAYNRHPIKHIANRKSVRRDYR
jgi:biotin carboxyl carrier protein